MRNYKEEIMAIVTAWPKKYCRYMDILDALKQNGEVEIHDFQRALKELQDEYELIVENGNKYCSKTKANVHSGIITFNRYGDGFVKRENDESIFLPQNETKSAMSGDLVLYRIVKPLNNTGTVLKILQHARDTVLGTYTYKGNRLRLSLDDALLNARVHKVRRPADFSPEDGMKVLFTIEQYGTPLILSPKKIVGYEDDPGMDILSVLLRHGVDPEYPDEVKEEAQKAPQEVSFDEIQGRKDLREVLTVTIDGEDARDFDDAVSIERKEDHWCLIVSIADVSHYVKEGSALDKEAYRRGCSVYVSDRAVGMLPKELSNGICSLNPNKDRLTLTCEMKVDFNGNIFDADVYESIICSNARLTYTKVNEIYAGNTEAKEEYASFTEMLDELLLCAKAIRRQREAKGAMDFDTPEAKIILNENGHPVSIVKADRGEAEKVIEDCMIAANVSVAEIMHGRDIPAVYRVHGEPHQKRIREFAEISQLLGKKLVLGKSSVYPKQLQQYLEDTSKLNTFPIISKLLLRCMQKAKYDANCSGHFGLGEEEYLHFTSPIRRYPDLVVHRMLKKYVFQSCIDLQEIRIDEAFCAACAEQSSLREREAQSTEFEVTDMKKAEYMTDHIGESYEGIITSVTSFGFFVQLDNTIEGLVHVYTLPDECWFNAERMELVGEYSGKRWTIGKKVRIVVASADKEHGKIDFTLAKGKGAHYGIR